LETQWQFFNQSHLADRPRYSSLMSNYQPILAENFTIIVELESQLQLDMFNEFKNELLLFLRKKLDNKTITLSLKTHIVEETKGKIYTVEDKFKYLSQLNPSIINLKKQLNLDFE
jgi:hypothetical protein